jgi:hypothetical protein
MGKQLEKIYEIVTQKAGLDARMNLASKTGVSKSKASEIPDTEELVNKFKAMASDLIGENIDNLQ